MCSDRPAPRNPRVLILSSRNWGELGNRLSAGRLQAALQQSRHFARIDHESFEDYCPYFAEIGQRIRSLSQSAEGPEVRNRAYNALIDEVERARKSGSLSEEALGLARIRALIDDYSPDIVVGTKGFISHVVCLAVGPAQERGVRVVNYVTNDGLLTLPIHASGDPDLQIVQTEDGRRRLLASGTNLDPQLVHRVGPLISRPSFGVRVPLNIGVFINRGGEEYWALVEALESVRSSVRVQIVCAGNDDLLDRINRFVRSHDLTWDVDGTLEMTQYLARLDQLASRERRVFVCKSAPSTVFEALARGIPVLAMDSGLPMERWVGDLVERTGTGSFFRDVPALIAMVRRLAAGDDAILERAKASMPRFIRETLREFAVGAQVSRLIADLQCAPGREVKQP